MKGQLEQITMMMLFSNVSIELVDFDELLDNLSTHVVNGNVVTVTTSGSGGAYINIPTTVGATYAIVGEAVGSGTLRVYSPATFSNDDLVYNASSLDEEFTATDTSIRVYLRNSVAGDVDYTLSVKEI